MYILSLLSSRKNSDMNEQVKILTGSALDVRRIASFLEENDIPSLIRDNVESARVAGFGIPSNSVELYVYASDEAKALEIIDAFQHQDDG